MFAPGSACTLARQHCHACTPALPRRHATPRLATAKNRCPPESIRPTSDEEKAFITRFVEACWQSDPPNTDISHIRRCNDPNAPQREYLALFVELTNHIPRLVQTMMDPDRRDDLSATTESMGRIIDGIRLLVGVQKRAQDELASL
ncbi:hypothetical protein GGX14DRAFT_398954 [Mycena pura]|uniref:Uncharacterized protein n=1 Tax=Mycena pura TaxID=153505 RepID=A0AAD6Y995_9AGAR|nr:hypothetical protein GGX14DRAFT_398954 [Mycena pura]